MIPLPRKWHRGSSATRIINCTLRVSLTSCGESWKSYQEDIDLVPDGTSFDNVVLPQNQWTSPLKSLSGIFVNGVNQFNGSTQFNYAAKHNPQAYFTDSNGGNDLTTNNPLRLQYAPLQQFFVDLANNHRGRLQLHHSQPVQ